MYDEKTGSPLMGKIDEKKYRFDMGPKETLIGVIGNTKDNKIVALRFAKTENC
jgi:hypothetical protein